MADETCSLVHPPNQATRTERFRGDEMRRNYAVRPRADSWGANSDVGPTFLRTRMIGSQTYSLLTGVANPAVVGVPTAARVTVSIGYPLSGFDLSGTYDAATPGTLPWVVAAGQVWTLSVWVRLSTGGLAGQTARLVLRAAASTSAWSAAAVTGPASTLPVGTWVRLSTTYTVPSGAVALAAAIQLDGTTPAGTVLDATALLAERAAALDEWFDGATPPGEDREYGWVGLPSTSASVQWAVESITYWLPTYVYPDGLKPVPVVADPLATHRSARFEYELQARDGTPKGTLDGVHVTGSLEYAYDARLKVGGKITLMDTGQSIDWLNDRIYIKAVVGALTWGLGVFIPTAPVERWLGGHRGWDVELHSKLLVLDQDAVAAAYSLDAGTVVTTAVRTLITSTGESAGSITDSTKTLAAPMAWEAGTPKLSIINNLLDAAGYFVLQVDGVGQYRALPYVVPSQRPVRYTLADGANAIYQDAFDRDQDIFSVPNRVIAIQQGTGGTEGLISVADNTDATSPFSIPSRGRVIAAVFTGVEATDQGALDTYARRQLVDRSAPSATVQIAHALVPLAPYDAVQFTYSLGALNARHVVDKTTVNLDPTALATSLIRQVVTY